MTSLRARAAVLAAACALAGCGRPEAGAILSEPRREAVVTRETVVGEGRLTRTLDVRLGGADERRVELHVREPRNGKEGLPAYLLLAGFGTGRESLDLVEERDDLVVASMDYPYDGPRPIRGWRLVTALPALRRTAGDTLRDASAALGYLAARKDVSPEDVVVVGVSFGSAFAAALGAHDPRVDAVVLVYGGGDLPAIVRNLPRPWWIPGSLAGRVTEAMFGDLDPLRHVAAIAPRPLLMVNSRADELVTPPLARKLYARAREPKKLVWYDTGHMDLFDPALVRRIVADVIRQRRVYKRGQTPPVHPS